MTESFWLEPRRVAEPAVRAPRRSVRCAAGRFRRLAGPDPRSALALAAATLARSASAGVTAGPAGDCRAGWAVASGRFTAVITGTALVLPPPGVRRRLRAAIAWAATRIREEMS